MDSYQTAIVFVVVAIVAFLLAQHQIPRAELQDRFESDFKARFHIEEMVGLSRVG
jgi:hypothetical protein